MDHYLTIKRVRPALLKPLVDRPVTPAQVSMIIALLDVPDLTYGEITFFLANRRQQIEDALDNPAGAGEDVEAFRG